MRNSAARLQNFMLFIQIKLAYANDARSKQSPPGKMSNSSYANPGRARIIMGATPFLKKNSIFYKKVHNKA